MWACRACGVRGQYRTNDGSKCAHRWGEWPSKFVRNVAGDCKHCAKSEAKHVPLHAPTFSSDAAHSGRCQRCGEREAAHHVVRLPPAGDMRLCEVPDMYCFPKYARIAVYNSNCARCGGKDADHHGPEKYCRSRRCCRCWFEGDDEVQHLQGSACKACKMRSLAGSAGSSTAPSQGPADAAAVKARKAKEEEEKMKRNEEKKKRQEEERKKEEEVQKKQIEDFAKWFETKLGVEDSRDVQGLAKACVEQSYLRCKSAEDMQVLCTMTDTEVLVIFEHPAHKTYIPTFVEVLRTCKAEDQKRQIEYFAKWFQTNLGLPPMAGEKEGSDAEDLAKACVEQAGLRCRSAEDMQVLCAMPEHELFRIFEHMPPAQKAYAPVIVEALRACKAAAASSPEVHPKSPVSKWMVDMGLDPASAENVNKIFKASEEDKVQALAKRRVDALMQNQWDIQKKKFLPYVKEVLEDLKHTDSDWAYYKPVERLERLRKKLADEFRMGDTDKSGYLTEDEFKAMIILKAYDDAKKAEFYQEIKLNPSGIDEEMFNIAPASQVPEITKGLVLALEHAEVRKMAFSLPRSSRYVFLEAVAIGRKESTTASETQEPAASPPAGDNAQASAPADVKPLDEGLSKSVEDWLKEKFPDVFDEATILLIEEACLKNSIRTCWSLMALESELDTILSAALPVSVIKMLRKAIKNDPRRAATKWKVNASSSSLKGKIAVYAPKGKAAEVQGAHGDAEK